MDSRLADQVVNEGQFVDDITKRSSTRMRVGLPIAILVAAVGAAYLGGILSGRGAEEQEE